MSDPRPSAPWLRWVSLGAGATALVVLTVVVTLTVERSGNGEEHTGEHDEHGHEEHGDHHEEEHGDAVELSDEQLREAGVELAAAGPGKVTVTIDLPGELALDGEALAHVGPRVGGTVREIKKKLGDEVEKGDVLALLDSRDVAEMQGEVKTARERLKLAKSTYDRKKRLYEEKIVSEKEYLEAKQAHAEAKVVLESASAALGAKTGTGSRGGGYALIAPLSGTIVEWHVGMGEVLEENTRAYTIADLSRVWVNITVYAKDLPRIQLGHQAVVRAEGIAEPIEGKISFISQTLDPVTRSASARIVLVKPPLGFRPGLFVKAEVEVDEVDAALVVSEAALQRHEGADVVFVREKEHVEVRRVERGRHGHAPDGTPVVEILGGLRPGDEYVAKNSFIIKAELGKGSAGHEH